MGQDGWPVASGEAASVGLSRTRAAVLLAGRRGTRSRGNAGPVSGRPCQLVPALIHCLLPALCSPRLGAKLEAPEPLPNPAVPLRALPSSSDVKRRTLVGALHKML